MRVRVRVRATCYVLLARVFSFRFVSFRLCYAVGKVQVPGRRRPSARARLRLFCRRLLSEGVSQPVFFFFYSDIPGCATPSACNLQSAWCLVCVCYACAMRVLSALLYNWLRCFGAGARCLVLGAAIALCLCLCWLMADG